MHFSLQSSNQANEFCKQIVYNWTYYYNIKKIASESQEIRKLKQTIDAICFQTKEYLATYVNDTDAK